MALLPAETEQDNALVGAQALQPPELIDAPNPIYPEAALVAQAEGIVRLRLWVSAQGVVERVELLDDPGHGLGHAAMVAATAYRFRPAHHEGRPVAVHIDYDLTFVLPEPPAPSPGRLSGIVLDALGQPLSGARVWLGDEVVSTDGAGRFVFEAVVGGTVELRVEATGHPPYGAEAEVVAGEETAVALRLEPVVAGTDYETVVVARRLRPEVRRRPLRVDASPTVSRFELTRRDIELTPGSLEDVARVVQSMPGVVGEPGLLATFFVRGGDADEVVFYLNGVPLNNAFHLGGFATLFNPELLEGFELYAGGQPARYRNSLSGTLDIEYVSPPESGTHGLVDVSMHTAKASVSGETGLEGLSFLLSARRSYFEAYFEVLQAVGVIGEGIAAPNIGEYVGMLTWRRGAHRLDLTVLRASDGLKFISRQDDDALISFEGELRIANATTLVSPRWRWSDERLDIEAVAAFLHDDNESERFEKGAPAGESSLAAGPLLSSADSTLDTAVIRLDGTWWSDGRQADGNTVRAGLDASWWRQRFRGRVPDERTFPTWSSSPLADYQLDAFDVEPSLRRAEVGLYLEDTWKNLAWGLSPQLGMRVDLADGEEALVSPRGGLSWVGWPGGVIKLAGGLYHQRPADPVALDDTYGNPKLRAERAGHLVFGVEQLLPARVLARVEGWVKWLDRLVVNPDTDAAIERGITYRNQGRGRSWGADVLLAHRTSRGGAGLTYGYLQTERKNPLNDVFERAYVPGQQQTHTFGVASDVRLQDRWVVSARYEFHTSRPFTPIVGWQLEPRADGPAWVPILGRQGPGGRRRVNDRYHRPFHEVSARVEYWIRNPRWRVTLYAEVINITNYVTTFVDSYDEGDPARGMPPASGAFETLPIRPFVGVRGEL